MIDSNPHIAAQNLGNRHVVKMLLESVQILCTTHRILDKCDNPILYKSTHVNHPSNIWVRESYDNYMWLYEHYIGLLDEYTFRYGKVHSCDRFREFLKTPPKNIPKIGFTNPRLAMPNKYKSNDYVESYRNYYRNEKQHLFEWKNRNPPSWIQCIKS